MSRKSVLFRASVHALAEGRLHGFQRRIALNGVKNAVKCDVYAGNDNFCCIWWKQLTIVPKKMLLCCLKRMFLKFSRVVGCTDHNGQNRLCAPSPIWWHQRL